MRHILAKSVLLPDQWHKNTLISYDASGVITAVTPDASAELISTASKDGEFTKLDGTLLPGMPNCHSHAHQRVMAGLAERSGQGSGEGSDSFWTWRELMYRCLAKITADDLQVIASQLYIEMLKAGYTRVAEFQYLHHGIAGKPYDNPSEMTLQTLAAAQQTGIAITLLPVLYQTSGFGGAPAAAHQNRFINDADSFTRLYQNCHDAIQPHHSARLGIAPHSLRAVTPELLSETLSNINQITPDGPIHIHIAEQLAEVEQCLSWSKQRPVSWLYNNQNIDSRWCLIHATHLDDSEISQIANSAATVGICPTTEANLGDGIFPSQTFLQRGGKFAIGSDSHISLDPTEELRWLEYAQRLLSNQRTVLSGGAERSTGRSLFQQAVAGGNQACGARADISVDSYADFILLDDDNPALAGKTEDALLDSWIFFNNRNQNPIKQVYVGGKLVIEQGRHAQEAEIAAQFATTVKRLLQD